MAKVSEIISSIFEGISPTYYFGGSYLSAFGIDPDRKVNGRLSGAIKPTSIEQKAEVDGNAMWIKPNPITANSLIYTDSGKLYGITPELTIPAQDEGGNNFPISLGESSGNGLHYYNNYYYAFKDKNIARYGKFNDLDNLELDDNWWTSAQKKVTARETINNGELYQSSVTNVAASNSIQIVEGEKLAMSIETGITGNISFTHLDIPLASLGADGDIRVSIQGDSAGEPDGNIESSSVRSAEGALTPNFPTQLPTNEPALVTFELSDEVTIGNNSTKWIVIEQINGTTGGFNTLGAVFDGGWESGNFSGKLMKDDSGWADIDDGDAALTFRAYFTEDLFAELNNKEYPKVGGKELPNHTAHFHTGDGNLYFCNFNNNKFGEISRIQTLDSVMVRLFVSQTGNLIQGNTIVGRNSRAKALILGNVQASQGIAETEFNFISSVQEYFIQQISGEFEDGEILEDLNGTSRARFIRGEEGKHFTGNTISDALRLPKGYAPIDIESYGLDLAILAVQTSEDNSNQGNAALFLWDAVAPSFYRQISLPFPLATAIHSHLGVPLIWGGDEDGYSFSRYVGGESLEELSYVDNGHPPFPGAVNLESGRVMWGTTRVYDNIVESYGETSHIPETRKSVLAWGSVSSVVPKGIHNIYSLDDDNSVYSLGRIGQSRSTLAIGSDNIYGEGGNSDSMFITKVYSVNSNAKLKEIRLSLERPVDEDTEIKIRIIADNGSVLEEAETISDELHPGKQVITIYPNTEIKTNFFMEFEMKDDNAIMLPINFVIETETNA